LMRSQWKQRVALLVAMAAMVGVSEARDQEGKLTEAKDWYDHSSVKEVRKDAISDEAKTSDHNIGAKPGALKTIDEIKKIAKRESDKTTRLHHKENQPELQRFSGWSNKKHLLDGWKLEQESHKNLSPPAKKSRGRVSDGSSFFLNWGDASSKSPAASQKKAGKREKPTRPSPLSLARKAIALERMKRRKKEADLLDKASKSAQSILDRKAQAHAQETIARQAAYQNVEKTLSKSPSKGKHHTEVKPRNKAASANSESQKLAFERLKLRKMIFDLQRAVGRESAQASGQDATKLSDTLKAMNKIEGILTALKKKLSSLQGRSSQPTLSQDHEATAGGRGRTSTVQGQGTGPATNPPSSHSKDVSAKGSGEDWMKTKEKKWEDWMPIPGFGEKKSWLLKRTP